ncbi:MAG: HepT-like ribonuclease domain-containing protein, partial [Gemmatimonadota bacterium]
MLIEPESSPPLRDIAESLGLRLLVVFESLAAGRGNAASDLDIGVLSGGVPATAVSRCRSGRHRAVRRGARGVAMTSLDREVVRRKLAHLAEALEALRPLARLSFSDGTSVGLGDAGVLEGGLATRLAPSAGLRNRLVHEYNGLDDRKV